MPALLPHEIADFVNNTLRHFDRTGVTDISYDLQQHYVASQMFFNGQKLSVNGGEKCQWQVKIENSNLARTTGLYDTDESGVNDLTTYAVIPWAMQETKFTYDIREDDFQGERERIIDYVRLRRHAALMDFYKLMETQWWQEPQTQDGRNRLDAYGLLYWVQPSSTTGFNGLEASAFSNVAGIDPTPNPAWRNWTDTYTSISRSDLIKKLDWAAYNTGFEIPVPIQNLETGGGNERVRMGRGMSNRFQILTTWEVTSECDSILENQNDNLRRDLRWSGQGVLQFKGNDLLPIPYLDRNNNSNGVTGKDYPANPVIGINLATFSPFFKSGWYMKWGPPLRSKDQRHVYTVAMDNTCQFKCVDRRQNFFLYQLTA